MATDGLLGRVRGAIGGEGDHRGALPCSADEAFDVLSTHRRRHVIEILADRDEPTTVGELADAIAFVESDAETPGDVTSQERKRAYVSLYQTHIPFLDEIGIVDWGDPNGDIDTSVDLSALIEAIRSVETACEVGDD